MAKPDLDMAAEIARLESLSLDHLREEWRRLHQTPGRGSSASLGPAPMTKTRHVEAARKAFAEVTGVLEDAE